MSLHELPERLPVPEDDGAADHLTGLSLPPLRLPATVGATLDLAQASAELLVLYVYPMTGTPGQAMPEGWDDIPGARGCTPQGCAFRDALTEFERHGAAVVGLSAQPHAEQRDFAAREQIPFPLLADPGLELARELRLPTFEAHGRTVYRRLTLIAQRGRIVKVFYPVFPPDRNATEVLAWLAANPH